MITPTHTPAHPTLTLTQSGQKEKNRAPAVLPGNAG